MIIVNTFIGKKITTNVDFWDGTPNRVIKTFKTLYSECRSNQDAILVPTFLPVCYRFLIIQGQGQISMSPVIFDLDIFKHTIYHTTSMVNVLSFYDLYGLKVLVTDRHSFI